MRNLEDEASGPLLSHVQEFFSSFKKLILTIVVGAGVGYLASETVVAWLTVPFQKVMGPEAKLIYLSPFEKVWVHLRAGFWSGTLLVAPGLFWSIYNFVAPALPKDLRKKIVFMGLILWIIFWGGVIFAQAYSIPLLLKALVSFKALGEAPFLALAPYMDMSLGIVLATALLFELPIMMLFLTYLNWISVIQWRQSRRVAIVINAGVSAVLSPPDAVSMLLLMIPIQLLYEVGIVAALVSEKCRRRA